VRSGDWRLGFVLAVGLGLLASATLLVAYTAGHGLDAIYGSLEKIWVNVTVVGYVVGWPMYSRLAADVERLMPLVEPAERATVRRELGDAWSNRGVWVARAAGAAYGIFASTSAVSDTLKGIHEALVYLWVPVVIPVLWTLLLPALWRLICLSSFVFRFGRDDVRIDFGDMRELGAFADIGIRHLLLIALGLTVIPMQAILTGPLEPADFVPALVVTVPVALIAVILPMWGIHGAMTLAKHREFERLTAMLRTSARDSDRFLLLSMYRQQIADVSEWPLSARSAPRVLFYVVIPPFAWVAAALVQDLVSNMLGLH
jgi:hypothetical protein